MIEEYERLDKRVQKWLFNQGWPDLREIQKRAIAPILSGDRDVLISPHQRRQVKQKHFFYQHVVQ
jgi:ATP-dependent helicase Lhr and Lhr-like helicase